MTNLRKRSLAGLLVLLALPMTAQEPLRCTAQELAAHPLGSKDLVVTILSLDGYKAMAAHRKHSGRARMSLSLENRGTGFSTFSPQAISLVGKDGAQVFPIYELNLADDTVPMTLRVAPGAHVTVEYVLTGRLSFPAKVYLGEVLVAQVTE